MRMSYNGTNKSKLFFSFFIDFVAAILKVFVNVEAEYEKMQT